MINVLRKNQKGLWIVIAILCIPFVFYFSNSNVSQVRNNQFGLFHGRPITQLDFQKHARLFDLARDLGMQEYLQSLIAGANTQDEAYVEFTWNRLILNYEADQLGIKPSIEDVGNYVRQMPAFQGEKGFDAAKFNDIVQSALPSRGFSEAQLQELAADQLALDRIKGLVSVGARVPDSEARDTYQRLYGKLNVWVTRVHTADAAKNIQIGEDDIAKYFEVHKAQLNTDEKRKVSFVTFVLSDEQKKLSGKERVEALQKLADQANDFSQALLEKGSQFEQVAAKLNVPVKNTAAFSAAAPDPMFAANSQLAASAFQLTSSEPNSDALQTNDGFYILHLAAIDAAKPLTLEEAKPKITEAVKSQRTRELVTTRGGELVAKIREAVKPGASIDAALKQTGVAVEKIPPFALADQSRPKPPEPGKEAEKETPDLPMIKNAVAELQPGEVSQFVPTQDGGLVAILEKREPADAANNDQSRNAFLERMENGKRDVVFYEWLRERRTEAGVRKRGEPAS